VSVEKEEFKAAGDRASTEDTSVPKTAISIFGIFVHKQESILLARNKPHTDTARRKRDLSSERS